MKRIINIILFVFVAIAAKSQTVFQLKSVNETVIIDSSYVNLLIDTTNTILFKDVLEVETANRFVPFKNIPKLEKRNTYWLRIQLQNSTDREYDWLVHMGFPSVATIIVLDTAGQVKQFKTGTLELGKNKPPYESFDQSFSVNLQAHEQKTVFILLKNNELMSSILSLKISELSNYRKKEQQRYLFQGIFFGLLLMMFLYNLFLFFTTRDLSYLYYVLFVGIIGLFFLNIGGLLEQIIPNSPRLIFALGASHYYAFVFYFVLLRVFSANITKPANLDKWLKTTIYTSAIGSVLITVVLLIDFDLFIMLSSVFTVLIVLTLLAFSVILSLYGSKLSKYFVLGTFFMIIGALVMVAVIVSGSNYSFLYAFEIGVAAEIVIFSFGLSYRFKLNEQLRLHAQEKLIEQLKENEHIKDEANRMLEQKVIERTAELNNEKIKVEESHKRIKDSINYASRIQEAMLPSVEILKLDFLDHFLLYKPRDIVSGDFYWFRQIENYIFIVAADCTGHGVPGAFMSMLGISQLNEIVASREVNQPNEILNELRRRIKKSLHQEGQAGQTTDGMDIAICVIDIENKTIQFSGAHNPMYIIRKNESTNAYELLETKADKMPIGVHPKENQQFKNNVLQLLPGDAVYLFSDGYVSQFGGAKNEKFKTKRFQELLLTLQHEPMAAQKELLAAAITAWKGNYEQIDDILVIGLKVS